MKTVDISETVAASDLKGSTSRDLIEFIEGRVHTKIQTGFSHNILCRSEPNFVKKLSGARK